MNHKEKENNNIEITYSSLSYQSNKCKYIVTFTNHYPNEIEPYLEKIYNTLFYYYSNKNISYSKDSNSNVDFICNHIKLLNCITGKISIKDWIPNDSYNIEKITSVYGPIQNTIGADCHNLVYLKIPGVDEQEYHIAIETSLFIPYNLQFYVGTSLENLDEIIQKRYQCKKIMLRF